MTGNGDWITRFQELEDHLSRLDTRLEDGLNRQDEKLDRIIVMFDEYRSHGHVLMTSGPVAYTAAIAEPPHQEGTT